MDMCQEDILALVLVLRLLWGKAMGMEASDRHYMLLLYRWRCHHELQLHQWWTQKQRVRECQMSRPTIRMLRMLLLKNGCLPSMFPRHNLLPATVHLHHRLDHMLIQDLHHTATHHRHHQGDSSAASVRTPEALIHTYPSNPSKHGTAHAPHRQEPSL